MIMKEFIEVTALYDGRKAMIRAACIDAVTDNAPDRDGYGMKPECRTIFYNGGHLDVTESYEEIQDLIYKAEL